MKQTSKRMAGEAAKVLSDSNASSIQQRLAGSVLSQYRTRKQTGSDMEDLASKALASPKYSETTKSLAGSVLSQSSKER